MGAVFQVIYLVKESEVVCTTLNLRATLMAHSTTATSTYVLAKYSRSYPSKTSTQSQDTSSEWQHFTNPLISLILDIKKSDDNELESMRLRILWRINHDGPEDSLNNTEVVFASLELLRPNQLSLVLTSTIIRKISTFYRSLHLDHESRRSKTHKDSL